MPVNVHGIVIPLPMFEAKSRSKMVILGHPSGSYAQKCKRNLDDGSCAMAISAANGSEQVMFVTTFPENKRDIFASSSANLYT